MSLLIGTVLLEVGLRVLLGNFGQSKVLQRSDDPDICLELEPSVQLTYTGWRARTPPTTLRTNSYGIRGPEFAFTKPPGTLRVAIGGDSFTFGQGVEEDEAFAQVAAGVLSEAGTPTDVLNFGVPGHGTPQAVALLRKRALPTRPDLVLVSVFANDLSPEDSYCLYGQGGNAATAFTLRNLYLGRLLYFLANPVLRPRPEPDAAERLGSPGQRFQASLRELSTLGRERDFLTAVVLLTDRNMFLQSRYCQGCEAAHDLVPGTGVHVIDMSQVWTMLQEDIGANFIPGDDHLSVAGNQLMGAALGQALRSWPALRQRATTLLDSEER